MKVSPRINDRRLKLRAMALVSQLPEDPVEARQVLAYAMEIVNQFMVKGGPQDDSA